MQQLLQRCKRELALRLDGDHRENTDPQRFGAVSRVEEKGGLPDTGGSADHEALAHVMSEMVEHSLDTRDLVLAAYQHRTAGSGQVLHWSSIGPHGTVRRWAPKTRIS